MTAHAAWPGVIQAYRDFLSIPPGLRPVTLLEGGTPLLRAARLSELLGLEVWLKLEGCNPTGSFKDRGMTVAVSVAAAQGATTLICASTGNTAASAAAYAARAGLTCWVVIPDGKVTAGNLSQVAIHGARTLSIDGTFEQALDLVRHMAERHPVVTVNSFNPLRLEGQKTAAFEICDVLGRPPDYMAMPVGNATNLTACWRGFCQYKEAGRVTALPQMLGFQAAGAAPLVKGEPVIDPQTVATAIRIGHPASWEAAIRAVRESGGLISSVDDADILSAHKLLAREEGVFAEPASAAPIAGLMRLARERFFTPGQTVVCAITGSGLKDPSAAAADAAAPTRALPPRLEVLEDIFTTARRPRSWE